MVDILKSSITVSFGDDRQGSIIWEEDNTRSPSSDAEMYLRLYPGAAEVIRATSGSLVSKGQDVAEISNLVVFSGETEYPIPHPNVTNVTITSLGSAYDLEGNSIAVSYSYNVAKGSIIVDKACYGIIEIEYQAPYQVYLYTFSGGACEIKYVAGAWIHTGGYTPAYVIALNPSDGSVDTIQLTPEDCNALVNVKVTDKTSGPVNLVLEIHKDFPPRISSSSAIQGIGVSCKVRQIPAVDADIDLSSGSYAPENFVGSTSVATKDTHIFETNNYEPKYTEVVKDLISFNVGYSAKLKYQPAGSISVVPSGPFLDKWGNTVSPSFAKPGDTIMEVEWINEHTYRNPVERIVQDDEIVALTTGNKTTDVYGSAAVSYSIQYRVYDVKFQQADALKAENGWESIHMLAKYEGQTAYLSIPAPSLKEK